MGEGLFPLGALATPFDQAAVAAAVVRLEAPIYFLATVFPDRTTLHAFAPPPPDRPTDGGRKVFLDEGAVLWYVGLTRADLARIAADPGAALQPALFEIVRGFAGVERFPAQRLLPLQGGAAGFCVAADGRVLTNYHVAREEIEAARRTGGSSEPIPCRYLRTPAGPGLRLLANPPAAAWKAGHDWALLQLAGAGLRPLPLAERLPEPGEPVWSFGFPMRTARNAAEYPDADGSLRVTRGTVTELRGPHLFVADLDGFSGNSGGPVVDRSGAVLGMVHNVEPPGELARRGTAFRGGMLCVSVRSETIPLRAAPPR
jgi:hypothetical protein